MSIDRCFPSGAKNSIILNAENWLVGNPRRNKLAVGATTCVVCGCVLWKWPWMLTAAEKILSTTSLQPWKKEGGGRDGTPCSRLPFLAPFISLSLFSLYFLFALIHVVFFPLARQWLFADTTKPFPLKKRWRKQFKDAHGFYKNKIDKKEKVRYARESQPELW